jgi:gliding motility-associated-like protein
MKKILFSFLFLSIGAKLFSQGAPACPEIIPGPTQTVCNGVCTTLTSTLVTNNTTTSYAVSSIPYAPYSFTTGTPVLVNIDDKFTAAQNLLFNFCFFGNTYSQCVVGANGAISFNTADANKVEAYVINSALPVSGTNGAFGANLRPNSIAAVFRDIDPSIGGNIYYNTGGTAPCRYVTISWYNIPLYENGAGYCDGTPNSTFQLVLYENTNYIDVYIKNSYACSPANVGGSEEWNNGYGICGIQNSTATTAYCPAGRNMGAWTATNEAWRFTPTGAASYTFNWKGPSGTLGAATTQTVCPSTTTTYTATMVLTNCDGTTYTTTATQQVVVNASPTVTVNSPSACGGAGATLTAGTATSYSWTPSTGLSGTTGASVTANPASTTVYSVTGTTAGCSTTVPATVTVVPNPTVTVNSATVCAGTSATFTAIGASTYSWTPSTGLSATTGSVVTSTSSSGITYSVTGTNSGCSQTKTAVLTINPSPTVTVNNPSICIGNTALVTANGTTSYSWSTSATTNTISVSPTTTTSYTVTGTSAGCTSTTVSTVSVSPTPTVTVNNPTMCPGGAATLTATGASTYSWSTGAATTSITVSPGSTQSYTVVGTTGTCTSSAVSTVTIGSAVSVTVPSATICTGSPTTLTASGATTYTWSPATGLSATSGTSVTANPASTITYTISGASGTCTGSTTAVVTVNPTPTITATSGTICVGQQTATLTASGANTYTWTPAATLSGSTGISVTANPAATTNYTISGTDINGCVNTGTTSVTVNTLPTITANSSTICAGQQTATLTASGANTYTWAPAATLSGSTGTSVTANPATTTNYTITGTNTNGCINTGTTNVVVNSLPTVTVNSPTICTGTTATLTALGATTYSWTAGLSATNGASVTESPATTTPYTVTGTDANTCTNTAVATINVIGTPTITVNSGTICKGQTTLTLTVNSNAGTFAWSPATGLSATTGSAVVANPTSTQVYTIVGTAGTCTVSTTATVTVNIPPTLTTTSSTICVGQQVGTMSVSGANNYVWQGGGIGGNTSTNPTDNPASTTIYTVTGTDINTCTAIATSTITVNTLPTLIVTSASICNGAGPATLGVSGANTYTWTGGSIAGSNSASPSDNPSSTTIYTVNGTDVRTCTATATATITVISTPTISVNSGAICKGQTTLTLTATSNASTFVWSPAIGLSVTTGSAVVANPTSTQTYTIVGTAGTCTVSTTATVTVNTPPTLTTTSSTICFGQQTGTVTVSGANTYVWQGGSIGGNTSTNPTDNPASTTIYTVSGTDVNTCTATATSTITVNSLPIVTATSTSVCPGSAGTITAGGASTYTWSTNTNGVTLTQAPANTTNYTLTGTDVNTCTNTAIGTIYVYTNFSISVNSESICAAGQQTATLTASGASTYVWSPTTGINTSTGNVVITTPIAVSNVYTVTGTSAVGSCTATATSTLTVNALPLPTATSNTPCASQQALNLNSTPNGLTSYTWAGPNSYTSSIQNPTIPTASVTAATAGVYTVVVVDGNQCINSTTVNVVVNALPVVTATTSPVCVNQTIQLAATGGVSYSWSGQSGAYTSSLQNPTISNATATMSGVYVVTVTDANGCVNANVAQVVVNALPTVTVNSSTICVGQQTATLTASGASTYSWSPANMLSSSSSATVFGYPSSTTNYTVTGINATGCVSTATTSIFVNTLPVIITNTITPDCISLCTAFSATSTPAASSYNWSFGSSAIPNSNQPSPTQCFSLAGTYQVKVTVTDIHGCNGIGTTLVNALAIPIADFDYGQQPISVLAPEVQFTNQSTPGLPHYYWNFGDIYGNDTSSLINPSHIYTDAGTYSVTLTVATITGCSATVVKPIVINEDYALYVPNAFSPNGDGVNEIFKPVGEGFTNYKLYIFDRWGLMIFYTDDINKGWDGKILGKGSEETVQQDVYVWKIQLKDYSKKDRNLHGTVTLLK